MLTSPPHRIKRPAVLAAPAAVLLSACVSVRIDQDKPIKIELDVNVRQEIVVRLDQDVRDLVRSNPDLF